MTGSSRRVVRGAAYTATATAPAPPARVLPPFRGLSGVYPSSMDERTFTRLAEEYAGRLYSVAYRMLGNRADAEDAVQRALLKCFAARASYSPQWAVSTWLYRALTNVCIDELRRRRVRNEADLDPEAIGGDGATPGP